MFQHIYLSPHFDDASLSCGGVIHQHVQAGEPVLVVTVCAGPPPANNPLSSFAAQLQKRWGSLDNAIALRQAEDQASMTVLGADYLRLDFADCIYRGQPEPEQWYYQSNADIFGPVHPSDLPLALDIAEAITHMVPYDDELTLYAPLAVGHHVDHQLVYAAALLLHQAGWPVLFYEDYPYVDPVFAGDDNPYSSFTLEATLNGKDYQARICPLSEENLQIKINSVAAYASQLDILFGGAATMQKQLRAYALMVGHGSPAERVWAPG